MNSEQMIALAMKRRAEAGLCLTWFIPDENRNFTAFPKDEAQKQTWIKQGEIDGWKLI